MEPKHFPFIFLLFACLAPLWGQQAPARDSLPAEERVLPVPADTIPPPDSVAVDLSGVAMSKDSLDFPVDYTAEDSMRADFATQRIYLFGNAEVKYSTITLKADYIVLDYETKIVTASGVPDSTGQLAGLPEFTEGEQTFIADSMRYNFETRKGVVYEVTSNYNDVVVVGQRTKFVTGEEKDSVKVKDDILYSQNAIFTTCAHDHPHFGIRSRKQKVIPDKLVVVGPSNLEIMGVPTPLWLPFGFFPISQGRRTGLLFPRDYEYSPQWGFGLRDIGWFFPLGQHFNLSLTADIYLKGTWGLHAYSQYRKRYKYSGSLRLGFASQRFESTADGSVSFQNSFSINWTHSQDRAAHPTNRFGGSINIQTNDYNRNVNNDAQAALNGQLNSNFSFEKNWLDKPFSFNAAFQHNQNTLTRQMTINFPTLQFQTQSLYPFKRRRGGGREKWYETFVVRYRGEAKNRFIATDTTLFSQKTLDDAQFGVRHDLSGGLSFKILKYFSLNPGASYRETWYSKTRRVDFVESLETRVDTIWAPDSSFFRLDTVVLSQGYLDTMNIYGFSRYNEYSLSLNLTTQIFGTLNFGNKGWLRGVRHIIKPSISFGFAPNYLDPNLGYYDTVPIDPNDPENVRRYSIFDGSIYGAPPASEQQMALSYSLNNIFEAKVFSRKDSSEKKIKLFDNIIINGSYNFAADSLKWSPISMSGTTRLFKGVTTFRFGAQFDPYLVNERGVRINKTAWKERGTPLRFVRADASINTILTVAKIRELFQGKEEEVVEDVRELRERRQERQEEGLLSLFQNLSINHNFSVRWSGPDGTSAPFEVTVNSLNMRGNFAVTKYWSINVGNFGYDFRRKSLTYPYVGFSRDLHCWELGLNWAPQRGTYSFFIRVKPGTLDFLRIPYEQNRADAIRAFQ